MKGNQLRRLMKKKKSFLGVFARECVPKKVKNLPAGFIFNNENSNLGGEHWLAVFITKKGKWIFFDSYGLPSTAYGLGKMLSFPFQVQHPEMKTCGLHAVYFLHHMMDGHVPPYSIDLYSNECKIKKYFD